MLKSCTINLLLLVSFLLKNESLPINLAILHYFLYSQNIQGEIKSQKNTPIENATLYNLNNHSHIHTDEEGKFILENTKLEIPSE